MSTSIRGLRRVVLAGGLTLCVVLVVFLGIARLKGHRFRFDLPKRLGVDITQTADGFTYSQSQKGHTLFTIHASKLIQYKGDQAELHDVTITLYGPEGSGRSDKIYGSDFSYDRKQGIARATGAVQIDFASPEGKPLSGVGRNPAAQTPGEPRSVGSAVHVTTSGVTFNQATGEATTDQRVDFVLARAAGSAIGATYSAKDGVLVLDHAVALTTRETDASALTTIHADHAQLLRDTRLAYLIKADALAQGRRSSSDEATVSFRSDGSAEQVEARGHVRLTTEDNAEVHSGSAILKLDPRSQPLSAELSGGVTYHSDDGRQTMQGSAVAGTLSFTPAPAFSGTESAAAKTAKRQELRHARFRNAVTFVLQQRSLAGDPNGSATREMRASQLDIDFAPGADGVSQPQHVLGVGGAMVNLHDIPSKGPAKTTSIAADQLLATLANGREFKLLDGQGNTRVVDTSADGATSTSTGDTLHVVLSAGPGSAPNPGLHTGAGARRVANHPSAAGASGGADAQIETAAQSGSVTLVQVPPADAKNADGTPESPIHATAQHAEYHAATRFLEMTGDAHLRNETVALSADRVLFHRDTGDAAAEGNIKSTYVAQAGQKAPTLGGNGPVHVTADHAELTRVNGLSIFYGTAALPARMWQGADAIAAPVLELGREDQSIDAHGDRADRTQPVVHATLGARLAPEKAAPGSASLPTASAAASPQGSATRLTSTTLHYADKDRRADLRGGVVAEQPSGVVHADQAQIYLSPSEPGKPSALDHLFASGHVVIAQPGRRGTGDKLVYTAADGRYILTGTPAQPPRITDAARGTTTGAALIFKSADDSVEVSSHVEGPAGALPGSTASGLHARTITDTHAPK